MALENANSSQCYWGGYGTKINNVTSAPSLGMAYQDLDGAEQTKNIINALSGINDGRADGAPAAEFCQSYAFPNGQKGYLGAAGEWKIVIDNKLAIKSALEACGSYDMLSNSNYWTSTQNGSGIVWGADWNNAKILEYSKLIKTDVRAFAVLD